MKGGAQQQQRQQQNRGGGGEGTTECRFHAYSTSN